MYEVKAVLNSTGQQVSHPYDNAELALEYAKGYRRIATNIVVVETETGRIICEE